MESGDARSVIAVTQTATIGEPPLSQIATQKTSADVLPYLARRYLLTANVADHTGQLWIQAFNDVGEQLLGVTANRLAQVRDQNESEAQTLIKKATGQAFVFNCRAKQETFNVSFAVYSGLREVCGS
jgi:Replication factor-A C terminal domain